MPHPLLTLQDLAIGYKGRMPLRENITEHFEAGEMVALTGRNGCGKSTLLRTIAGLQAPLAGQIYIGEKAISLFAARELARQVAVVLTHLPDTGFLRAEEAVALGRLPHTGFAASLSAEDRAIVSEAMRRAGAMAFAKRTLASLSDGERQRVMVAKALAQQTPLILLDEPLAFLDHDSKRAMLDLLRALAHEEGKTIILSSHDLELTLPYADCEWKL